VAETILCVLLVMVAAIHIGRYVKKPGVVGLLAGLAFIVRELTLAVIAGVIVTAVFMWWRLK